MQELERVSIRLVKESKLVSEQPIRCAEDAIKLVGEELCSIDREVVCAINLRSDDMPVNYNIVSIGSLNAALVSPREVFKTAILANAASIILVHNHPSGNLVPSREDIRLTQTLIDAGNMMDIPLSDHIIVGGENQSYYSFRSRNTCNFKSNNMYTYNMMDVDFNKEILSDIKKNGFTATPRLIDNIDALNEIRSEKIEIRTMKDIKKYGEVLKEEKQIFNSLLKECQRQELSMKIPCR